MKRVGLAQGVMPYFAFFAILLMLEWAFDIFEIGVGEYMRLSNIMRQKTGRFWVHEQKAEEGSQAATYLGQKQPDTAVTQRLSSLEELIGILLLNHHYQMSREDFLYFYKSLRSSKANELLDPLHLYSLARNNDWRTVRFVLFGREIQMYFLNGFGQLIQESYFRMDKKKSDGTTSESNQLDTDPQFSARIISGVWFYDAFDRLEKTYQLQIINDLSKLVQWQSDLLRVGISKDVEEGAVLIIFEVKFEEGKNLFEVRASEIAVNYLIATLNKLGYKPILQAPAPKGSVL
jgi:hypothetical protein